MPKLLNRRIRNRTYGGVRGRRGDASPTRSKQDWANFAVAVTVKDDSGLCWHPRTVTGENLNLREEQLEVPNMNYPQYKSAVLPNYPDILRRCKAKFSGSRPLFGSTRPPQLSWPRPTTARRQPDRSGSTRLAYLQFHTFEAVQLNRTPRVSLSASAKWEVAILYL